MTPFRLHIPMRRALTVAFVMALVGIGGALAIVLVTP